MSTTQSITVRRLQNLGDYSNKTIEETILLNDGDNADEEREKLLLKIEQALQKDQFEQVQSELRELRDEKKNLKNEIEYLKYKIDEYRKLLGYQETFIKSAAELLKIDLDTVGELTPKQISTGGDYENDEIDDYV